MIDFGSKVNERYSEFTHSQKMVAGYLMDHPDVAAFCSLQELSERIGVSTTTVIRFARMLDYSGYSDMQKDFQNNIQNKTALPERLENSGGTIPANQLLTKSFALDIQNIQETLSAQNDQDLEAAVNLIASSNKTYIFGMRSSYAMAHYLLGKADNGQGDDLMCIAHLSKAIVLKDDFTEARLMRAEALTKMHQYKEAMEDIEAILAQNNEDESALLLRGKIKEANGDTAGAETDYTHVTGLNPFNEQGFLYLGQLYIGQKKLTEAIALFDEAIELNPNFVQAYHERGRAKLLNGDKEGATEDMKKELELNPKESEAFNGQYNNQPGGRQTDILGL